MPSSFTKNIGAEFDAIAPTLRVGQTVVVTHPVSGAVLVGSVLFVDTAARKLRLVKGDGLIEDLVFPVATAVGAPVANVGFLATRVSNADVVALGAALTGDITLGTLPAKSVLLGLLVNRTGQAAGVATLTATPKTSGALMAAFDCKAAVGKNAATAVEVATYNAAAHGFPAANATLLLGMTSTVQNLDQTTGFGADVYAYFTVAPS